MLLAGNPPHEGANPNQAILPELNEDFSQCLAQGVNAAAADDLKKLVRQKVTEANVSDLAVTKDATFEPDVVTLAFSDRVRAFAWVTKPLAGIPLKTAPSTLCGLCIS